MANLGPYSGMPSKCGLSRFLLRLTVCKSLVGQPNFSQTGRFSRECELCREKGRKFRGMVERRKTPSEALLQSSLLAVAFHLERETFHRTNSSESAGLMMNEARPAVLATGFLQNADSWLYRTRSNT
jgi:hypothetical protein